MNRRLFLFLCALTLPAAAATPTQDFDHTHRRFALVLDEHVGDGNVDYAKLKKNPSHLKDYLEDASRVSKAAFDKWPAGQQLAFLLNLYNAATLDLIIQHYPLSSIKEISAAQDGPWKLPVVRLWDGQHSLDWLEHEVILAKPHSDPRVHFALVCAAKGCPALLNKPYLAKTLDRQLDEQGRHFMAQRDKNRFDAAKNTLHLSPIFQWYRADFVEKQSDLPAYVARFMNAADSAAIAKAAGRIRIAFTEYDWDLNEVRTH